MSLCAFIGMLSVLVSLSASADYYYTLDRGVLTDVQQAKSNWCWAACAEMAGHYVDPNTDKTQWAVVRYFKGTATEDFPDVGGNINDIAAAIRYVSNDKVTYRTTTDSLRNGDIYNEVVLADRAAIAGMGYYDIGGEYHGHAVLVYGTRHECGVDYVVYSDPAEGKAYREPYNDFKNGTGKARLQPFTWEASAYCPW